jgi:hypothetical protein
LEFVAALRLAALLALVFAAASAFAATPSHRILVLYSDNHVLPSVAVIDEALNAALRARFGSQVGRACTDRIHANGCLSRYFQDTGPGEG